MGRALALLLTLVLGMFARPAQGRVADADDHSLEAAEPGGDVANHERRPTVVQRFERPRTGGDPGTSWGDDDAFVQGACAVQSRALVKDIVAPQCARSVPRSIGLHRARSRGPPATHR